MDAGAAQGPASEDLGGLNGGGGDGTNTGGGGGTTGMAAGSADAGTEVLDESDPFSACDGGMLCPDAEVPVQVTGSAPGGKLSIEAAQVLYVTGAVEQLWLRFRGEAGGEPVWLQVSLERDADDTFWKAGDVAPVALFGSDDSGDAAPTKVRADHGSCGGAAASNITGVEVDVLNHTTLSLDADDGQLSATVSLKEDGWDAEITLTASRLCDHIETPAP